MWSANDDVLHACSLHPCLLALLRCGSDHYYLRVMIDWGAGGYLAIKDPWMLLCCVVWSMPLPSIRIMHTVCDACTVYHGKILITNHSEPFDVYRLSIAFDLIKQEQMQINYETRRAN